MVACANDCGASAAALAQSTTSASIKSLKEGITLREAFFAVRNCLLQAGVEDAVFDASQLVLHTTGVDRRLHANALLTASQAATLYSLTAKRAEREPLQYLLGEWDFLSMTLRVGRGVLIPRADTELVCETAIAAALCCGTGQAPASLRVVDLCAGSGAIALGVARAVPSAQVTAVELSDEALGYLRQNIASLAPRVLAVKADVFTWQNTLPSAWADVIVSNPPYITASEMDALAPELAFEPRMALEAAEDGLAFYRHIATAYRRVLRHGGTLVLEIGSGQADSVCKLLQEQGYTEIAVLHDVARLPRCVRATKAKRTALAAAATF